MYTPTTLAFANSPQYQGDFNRTRLPQCAHRVMKEKETALAQRFRVAWTFLNPRGEMYLLARFSGIKGADPVIVTLAYYWQNVGWVACN